MARNSGEVAREGRLLGKPYFDPGRGAFNDAWQTFVSAGPTRLIPVHGLDRTALEASFRLLPPEPDSLAGPQVKVHLYSWLFRPGTDMQLHRMALKYQLLQALMDLGLPGQHCGLGGNAPGTERIITRPVTWEDILNYRFDIGSRIKFCINPGVSVVGNSITLELRHGIRYRQACIKHHADDPYDWFFSDIDKVNKMYDWASKQVNKRGMYWYFFDNESRGPYVPDWGRAIEPNTPGKHTIYVSKEFNSMYYFCDADFGLNEAQNAFRAVKTAIDAVTWRFRTIAKAALVD